MIEIIRHIEYLLRCYDCVTLQGFGAFLANRKSAFYDESTHRFYPPCVEITFNSDLTHNDGLLSSSVARRNGWNFEKATKMIEETVGDIKSKLNTEGKVEFGNLGRFVIENERMVFHSTTDYAVMPQYFGMSQLNILPVSFILSDSRKVTGSRLWLKTARTLRIAASILVLVLIGLVCSTPVSLDSAKINFASVIPAESEICPGEENEVWYVEPSEQIEFYIALPHPDPSAAAAPVAENSSMDLRLNETDRYCLVVASLASMQQAESYILSHPSWRLAKFVAGDNVRVYAATSKNYSTLNQLVKNEEFVKEFPSAWICRR